MINRLGNNKYTKIFSNNMHVINNFHSDTIYDRSHR